MDKKDFTLKISKISEKNIGKILHLEGIIDGINQTEGPTIFYLDDGTGLLSVKGFKKPGERAHPDIEIGDAVKIKSKIGTYNEAYEAEIIQIHKLKGRDAEKVIEERKKTQKKLAKPINTNFMIKDKILDKLKDKFITAATEIRLAIIQNRPIIVRHHNDVDGYSSGYALEKAILPLIMKQHNSAKAAWEFFTRAPCTSPFYEIDDSIRDTSTSLRNVAKFSNKMPLVIIADNGSTEQDELGIKQGKIHGMDFIVVDHHYFEKDVISKEVLEHINPFLVGEDGTHFSAGMLASELAKFIYSAENIEQIPAMAGIADRINNEKAINQYLEIAKKKGYDKKLLNEIAKVIDFISAKLKFMEAREYIEVLFGEPRKKQEKLVKLMVPYIDEMERKGLEMSRQAAEIEIIKQKKQEIKLLKIDVKKTYPGFGFYPKPGMCIGRIHDEKSKEHEKLISAGIMDSAITMRATDEANFSVNDLIPYLNKKLPDAFVAGGGHKNAGSINFIPKKKDEVLKELKEFIKNR